MLQFNHLSNFYVNSIIININYKLSLNDKTVFSVYFRKFLYAYYVDPNIF